MEEHIDVQLSCARCNGTKFSFEEPVTDETLYTCCSCNNTFRRADAMNQNADQVADQLKSEFEKLL